MTRIIPVNYLKKVFQDSTVLSSSIGMFNFPTLNRLPLDADERIAAAQFLYDMKYHILNVNNPDQKYIRAWKGINENAESGELYQAFRIISGFGIERFSNYFHKTNEEKSQGLKNVLSGDEKSGKRYAKLDEKINPNKGKKNLEKRLDLVPRDETEGFKENLNSGSLQGSFYWSRNVFYENLADMLSEGHRLNIEHCPDFYCS